MQTADFLLLTINIRNERSFVKHELKGGLKYLGVEICTHPLDVTDIAAKSISTINISRYQCALTICRNSQTEIYLSESTIHAGLSYFTF